MTRRTPTLVDGLAAGRSLYGLCRAHGISPATSHRSLPHSARPLTAKFP